MVTQTLVVAPPGDRARAISTITEAFRHDPVCRWVWPSDQQYDGYFAAFVEAFAGGAFERGTAHALDDEGGVALWLPPGVHSDDDTLAVIAGESIAPEMHQEGFAFFEQQAEYHPNEPHWYLPLIGVHPRRQGSGFGSILLAHALRIVDEAGMPAYLEATTPRNKALYERHGFAETGQVIQAGSSPPMWPMWREPRGRGSG